MDQYEKVFSSRIIIPPEKALFPRKLYVHKSGIDLFSNPDEAIEFSNNIITHNREFFSPDGIDYLLVFLWGQKNSRMGDVYAGLKDKHTQQSSYSTLSDMTRYFFMQRADSIRVEPFSISITHSDLEEDIKNIVTNEAMTRNRCNTVAEYFKTPVTLLIRHTPEKEHVQKFLIV